MSEKSQSWQTFTLRLDWNLLKIFYQIVESRGVSSAAKILLRKQPTVSTSLRQLEDLLGVTLCKRGPSGFRLTAEGEKLYELVEAVAKLIVAAPNELNKVRGDLTGSLEICMISNVLLPIIEAAFREFTSANPRITLNISVYPWQEAVNRVAEFQADIAIVAQRVPSAALHYLWLCKEAQHLYCGPNHRLYGTKVRDPLSLSKEAFVLNDIDEAEEIASFRLRYGLGNIVRATSGDLTEVKRLILAGVGIGFLPSINATGSVEQPELWPLFDSSVEAPSYDLWAVSAKPNRRTLPSERFISTLASLVQGKEGIH